MDFTQKFLRFLDFKKDFLYFWIFNNISGFQTNFYISKADNRFPGFLLGFLGFQATAYEISAVSGPSGMTITM